jgi:Flp pilus assembly protein TadG
MTIQNYICQFLDAARRPLRANDGAAAVEFAIISAVLLPMLFAIIAFSTTLFSMSAMQTGAAEAARRVAVNEAPFTTGNVTCAAGLTAGNAEQIACRLMPAWGTYRVNTSLNCGTKDVTVTMTNTSTVALGDVYRVITGSTFTTTAVTRWEKSTCP